ncbi:DUF805 domain-containing protein [Pseudolysinimonas sp.]|uniref:DUF805 domain-containing protein n=1 Tax=Pseudolysinimonas sp. TaxID=2680009 RepID=UPI003F7F2A6E
MTTTPGTDRLDLPLYGASFGQAIARFYRNYATFSGRASRSEYWWTALFFAVVDVGLYVVTLTLGFSLGQGDTVASSVIVSVFGGLLAIVFLGSIVPGLAITWRRLHDAGYGGTYALLGVIPWVGGIILIVLCASASQPSGVRFDRGYAEWYAANVPPAVPPPVAEQRRD